MQAPAKEFKHFMLRRTKQLENRSGGYCAVTSPGLKSQRLKVSLPLS